MFDKLEDLLIRDEEVMGELQEPGVANDPERFRKLMKEQSDLAPVSYTHLDVYKRQGQQWQFRAGHHERQGCPEALLSVLRSQNNAVQKYLRCV